MDRSLRAGDDPEILFTGYQASVTGQLQDGYKNFKIGLWSQKKLSLSLQLCMPAPDYGIGWPYRHAL
jgi:hypothetical protein